MSGKSSKVLLAASVVCSSIVISVSWTYGQTGKVPTSYSPVVITEPFDSITARWVAAKPEIMKRQMDLLNSRYDLSDRPAKGVTMSRGKPIQEGGEGKTARRYDLGKAGRNDS